MKLLTDEALIKVIYLKNEYEPEAVAAAEQVINERNISIEKTEELTIKIKNEAIHEQERINSKQKKIESVTNLAALFTIGVVPIENRKEVKRLKNFMLLLLFYYVVFWYNNASLYYYYEFFNWEGLGFITELLLYGVLFPYGLFHFSKLQHKGWVIIFYLIFTRFLGQLYILLSFILSDLNQSFNEVNGNTTFSLAENTEYLEFYETNYFIQSLAFLFFASMVWFLLKSSILKLYKITPNLKVKHLVGATIFTVVYAFLWTIGFLYYSLTGF